MVVYESKTGNVERFIQRLPMKSMKVSPELKVGEPFVLVTYTTGFGQVPESVTRFLERNSRNLVGVAASGNRNWGQNFALSADIIASNYDVPVISKFEMFGTEQDIETFIEGVKQLETHTA